MAFDQYTEWAEAEGLNPDDDSTRDAYTAALVEDYERSMAESDEMGERLGMEASYPDYLDFDAVSQGMYDDDPSPYSGTYSEM